MRRSPIGYVKERFGTNARKKAPPKLTAFVAAKPGSLHLFPSFSAMTVNPKVATRSTSLWTLLSDFVRFCTLFTW